MEVFKEFTFESAHRLPNLPETHKCHRLHGHSFKARIYVEGPLVQDVQWVQDFADIKAVFEPYRKILDHNYLNEIEGLENPTSEVIAQWIWDKVRPELPLLSKVEVQENCTCGAIFRGEND